MQLGFSALVAFALVAFTLSLMGCWVITRSDWIKNVGNVELSDDRWHSVVTPGLGGVTIFIGFAIALILSGTLASLSLVLLICILPLLLFGTYDDFKSISPKAKLLIQIITAVLFLVLVMFINQDIIPDHSVLANNLPISLFHYTLCSFWLVAIVNAINLLDNMDGLAAGVSLIACLSIAYLCGESEALAVISPLYYLLAAALAGFLVLNWHPAKLFMGDAGSLWIGFTIAAGLVLIVNSSVLSSDVAKDANVSAYLSNWLIALLICAVPICDTAMVMVTRTMRGQPVSVGGKDHLSHRLVAIGLSQRAGVALLCLVALIASLLSIEMYQSQSALWPAVVSVMFLALIVGIVWLTNKTHIQQSS